MKLNLEKQEDTWSYSKDGLATHHVFPTLLFLLLCPYICSLNQVFWYFFMSRFIWYYWKFLDCRVMSLCIFICLCIVLFESLCFGCWLLMMVAIFALFRWSCVKMTFFLNSWAYRLAIHMTHTDYWFVWFIQIDNTYELYGSVIHMTFF